MARNLCSRCYGTPWSSGCATVVNGTRQKVGVGSNPPGATVLVDNQTQLLTPAAVDLARDQNHTFYFHKDGYQDDSFVVTTSTSGWVLGNILLGGLIGGIVDFSTGAARKLSQDDIHVTLSPLYSSQQPTSLAPMPPIIPQPTPIATFQPSTSPPSPSTTYYAPSPDAQLRNAEREFRVLPGTLLDIRY